VGLFHGRVNGNHASARLSKPLARSDELVIEELEDEIPPSTTRGERAASARWRRACGGLAPHHNICTAPVAFGGLSRCWK
jgi:hypothetical protein